MDNTKKKQVLEILDYWQTIELLGQSNIPKESSENKELIEKLLKGEKSEGKKIEILRVLVTPYVNTAEILEEDSKRFADYDSFGGELAVCLGKIERNAVVEYLERYVEKTEESPEKAHPKNSAIAWCSFKTDMEGFYLKGSFRLSPILWAIDMWEKSGAKKGQDFYLNSKDYNKVIESIDKDLLERNITDFLTEIYEKVQKEYVLKNFSHISQENMGFCEYNRYIDEETRDKDDNPTDYADLGRSFILNDIDLMSNLIRTGKFGDGNRYEEQVISYILAGHEKSIGMGDIQRTIISPTQSPESMRYFFENTLNIANAPIGKWPAKFMPALMQQVAVNIAIRKDDSAPIFSVNGPPGTGKTTLLKEIVANNIVERALILAKAGDDPDEAFEKHSFEQGPLELYGNAYYRYAPNYYSIKDDRINDYGILVASSNNAAVENITIDLPKGKEILNSLEAGKKDPEDVRRGLEIVHDLFDVQKSDDIETFEKYKQRIDVKDIYFTRYANKLLNTSDCWGLVSAPFGNRLNIRKYCSSVLKPYVEDYNTDKTRDLHKQKYKVEKEKFLLQYKKVQKMKAELEQICKLTQDIPQELQTLSSEDITALIKEQEIKAARLSDIIKTERIELIELEESRPRGLFGRPKKSPERDKMIAEKEELIAGYKSQLAQVEKTKSEMDALASYRALMEKYSIGAKKLTPIDSAFMEQYHSPEENSSKIAQVTNPWFTAEYNREREILFFRACKLHKEFAASSKCLRHNIINLMIAWNLFDECSERMSSADKEKAMPPILQSIFLLTPVISTTFASAQTFLGNIVKSGVLGTLIVDEAGQAQPQMAIGAMMRCRKAIIVGDPKQIEPVVTAETDMIKQLLSSKLLASYKDKKISVQGFADYINPYGTFLGEDEEREWVGCPLVVHRRCIDPMYTISNTLSYDGTMKQETEDPKEEKIPTFILEKSYWINVPGKENSGAKDHFVKEQGEVVLKLLAEKFKKDESALPNLFIITPFTSVKNGMIEMIRKSSLYKNEPRIDDWLEKKKVGTVHTFQGQGTDEVIFLLGCDQTSLGAVNWVNKNIVNVAATRAKYRFYVVGDKAVWNCKPVRIARECISNTISLDELNQLMGLVIETPAVDITPKLLETTVLDSQDTKTPEKEIQEPVNDQAVNTESTLNPIVMECPLCRKPLTKRNGKYGKFMGCTGFPDCRYTYSIKD